MDTAPVKSGLHARGKGERVLALESREGTRASRRGLTPRGSLECNPEIPAFPREEYEVPDPDMQDACWPLTCDQLP